MSAMKPAAVILLWSAFGTPGSSIPIGTTNASNIDQLRVNGDLSFGGFLDYSVLDYLQLEFMYTRNQSTYSQHNFVTGAYTFAYDSNIDQYQFGVLVPFLGSGFYRERKFVPYCRHRPRIYPRIQR